MTKGEGIFIGVDLDSVTFFKFPFKDLYRQRILDQTLDSSLQRPGTVYRIITLVGQQRLGCVGNLQSHFSACQVLAQPFELDLDDGFDFLAAKTIEDDDFIDPVQELRFEGVTQGSHHT